MERVDCHPNQTNQTFRITCNDKLTTQQLNLLAIPFLTKQTHDINYKLSGGGGIGDGGGGGGIGSGVVAGVGAPMF